MNKKWIAIVLLLLGAVLPQDGISSQMQYNQNTHNNSQASTIDNVAFLLNIINSSVTNNNQSVDPHANLDLNFDIDPYASLDLDIDTSITASSSTPDQLPQLPPSRSSQKRKATDLDSSVGIFQRTLPSTTTATLSTNTQPSKNKKETLTCDYIVNSETGKTCGKGFRYKSRLEKHIKTHTGEKSHICNYVINVETGQTCDNSFARTDTLKLHMRTHTREKPYRCTDCDDAFAQLIHLTRHKKSKKHKDKKTSNR